MFRAEVEERKIIDLDYLQAIGISDQVIEAYYDEEDLRAYIFINDNEQKYSLYLEKYDSKYEYYKVNEVSSEPHKKGKYNKVEIKKKSIEKIAKDIGFVNAQQLHAEDYHQYTYMPLRQYLKANKNEFKKKFIYEKDYDNNYNILRHKNLFSKYQDEISDFEKFTTIEKFEPKSLKISYEIDEDIFEYDDSKATIQERKFMRELAKDIYNKKNIYTERELFEILSGRDLYIQVVDTTPKEHKDVWSKVSLDDMDIRVLEKKRNDFIKQNVPENKKRKYLSKKQKLRKERRLSERNRDQALKEYYQYDGE